MNDAFHLNIIALFNNCNAVCRYKLLRDNFFLFAFVFIIVFAYSSLLFLSDFALVGRSV